MKKPTRNGLAFAKSIFSDDKAEITDCNLVTPPEIYKIYVLEYSALQQCFHIEELQSMVEGNVQAYLHGRSNDFVTIAVSLDVQSLESLIDTLREVRP